MSKFTKNTRNTFCGKHHRERRLLQMSDYASRTVSVFLRLADPSFTQAS